ncbi:MAG TPA: DUF11 domain-containing protein [Geomonas sp.]|nr:DUF11 domain-containing protein [Geomonas sp.]
MIKIASDGDASYLGSGVFESAASLQAVTAAAFQGTPAQFKIQLRNGGDLPDSFLLSGTGGANGFTVRFLDEAGVDRSSVLAGSGYATGLLAPGDSVSLLVQVTPAVITPGASFRVLVSAASSAEAAQKDQVKAETVACGSSAAVTVSAPADSSGNIGSVVSYRYAVTNAGSGIDSFTLAATTGNGWLTTLRAEDGTAASATGPLAPGATYRFSVLVKVPAASANGERADTHLSVTGAGASGTDDVTTTALAAAVSVAENVRNITQGGTFQLTATAVPGDTLEYRMSVTNSGAAPASALTIDTPVPANTTCQVATVWVGTTSSGDGSACAAADCGWARHASGSILAHLGQGATEAAGGSLQPGKTLYVYFRVQVD